MKNCAFGSRYIEINVDCNYRCRHCSYSLGGVSKSNPHYSLDDIKNGLTKLDDQVYISGGEPTIHPEFEEISRFLKSQGKQLAIQTNGSTLGNPRIRQVLKDCYFRIKTPINGHTSELCSFIAGAPLDLDAHLDNIRKLHEEAPDIHIMFVTVVTRDNIEYLDKILAITRELEFGVQMLNFPETSDRLLGNNLMVSYTEFFDRLSRIKEETRVLVITSLVKCVYDSMSIRLPTEVIPEWGCRHGIKTDTKCESCSFEGCLGINAEYTKLFGTDEIIPL